MKSHVRTEKKQIKINKSKVTEIQTKAGKVQVWAEKELIDDDDTKVLVKLTKLKHIFRNIVVLPDFHISGLLMNGSVFATNGFVYVNAIGGDIGCGMANLPLPIHSNDIEGKEEELYKLLHEAIPTGRQTKVEILGHIDEHPVFRSGSQLLTTKVIKKLKQQMGTIGDGNHFLEVQKNDQGGLQLLVHTGSRYLGQLIKDYYIKHIADMHNNALHAVRADSELGAQFLADHDLAVLFAKENRTEILRLALLVLKKSLQIDMDIGGLLDSVTDIPHNFISREDHGGETVFVHRKGAQKVEKGAAGIIPGDMGSATFMVEGKGYPLTFHSCSHGAGRKMARGKALDTIDYEEFKESVKDIACRTDRNVLDEAPQAYKDIEMVLKYQKEIVKITEIFMPVINIKG